jgi:hypothetical protein
LRVAFFAEVVLAMDASLKNSNKLRYRRGSCDHFLQQCGSIIGKPDWLPEPWAGI